jgi:hypothetical protein
MAGIIYLWFLWGVWIYSTFILNKNHLYRTRISLVALLLIIIFPFGISFDAYSTHLSLILHIIICFYMIHQFGLAEKLYLIVCSFIVGTSYAGFHMFAFYDPVWVVIEKNWLCVTCMLLLSFLLYTNSISSSKRMILIVMGTTMGEVFLAIIYNNNGLPYTIGSRNYLDFLSLSMLAFISIGLIQFVSSIASQKLPNKKGAVNHL